MKITFNPSFTGSKKKHHSNLALTAGIATALAVSPSNKIDAQNNKLQEQFKQLIATEFQKADINPTDYYVTEKELNEYLTNAENVRLADYDVNGDKKLNIDEFTSMATAGASKPETKTYTPQTQVQTNVSYTNSRHEAREIVSNLQKFRFHNVTKPGMLWGTNTRREFDYGAAFNDLKKINADNLVTVVKEAGRINGNPSPTVYDVYRLHTHYENIYARGDKHKTPYCQKTAKYLGKVMDDYATKHDLHFEELDECLGAIKAGNGVKAFYDGGSRNTNNLEKAYKLLVD